MIVAFKHAARGMLIGLLAVLSSCGGGGAGGNDGPTFQVSPSSITFTAPDPSSSAPAPQTITINVTSGSVVLGTATYSGAAISGISQMITGSSTAQVTVYPNLPSNLGQGTHTGVVTVHACANSNCSSEIPGSPQSVNVTYQIGGFSVTPPSINLSAVEGETPASASAYISHSSGSSAWTTSLVYYGTTSGWASLTPSSGASLPTTINVDAQPLNAGIYTAALNISKPGSTLPIPVTYTVDHALAPAPAALSFTIGTTVTPADLNRTLSVATNYVNSPGKTISWDAASDVAWLSVNPPSGNTGAATQLTATLDQSQVGLLKNGTYSGNITLSSTAAFVSPVTIPVTLTVDRAQINYVSPYVATASSSAEVIIRGKHFSQVTVQDVTFGGISASAFHVVSDTEIRATHPALTAGQYPVSAVTTTGGIASSATLVVTNPTALANLTFLDSSGVYKEILHDPERNAVLVFPMGGSFIERHTYNGSTWSSASVTLPYRIGRSGELSPDGKEIVLMTQDDRIVRVDAVTLSVLSATNPLTTYPAYLQSVAVMNDGNVLVAVSTTYSSSLHRFNLLTQSYTPIANSDFNLGISPIRTAGDGSHAILRYSDDSLYSYDAGTGQFAPVVGSVLGSVIQLDRTGARILSNYSIVYDASLTLRGTIPNLYAASCSTSNVVISQDGTRAYVYCSFSPGGRIYTYDLTATPFGGEFPEIGSYVSVPPYRLNFMEISNDGKALFLVETSKVTVLQLP